MIKLYNGDCLEIMDKLIKDGIKVDAIICDPPYGTTVCKWDTVIPFDEMWERINKIKLSTTPVVLFGSEPFSSMLRISNLKNYKYDWVWEKPQGTDPLLSKHRPLNNIEYIHIFSEKKGLYNPQFEKGIPYTVVRDKVERVCEINNHTFKKTKTTNNGTRYPKRILRFKKERGFHPTQKPVELLEYLIKTYTNEGDLVLDFTMGSGSTGVACKNLNRRFIGIELDEKYFEIAKNRMEVE